MNYLTTILDEYKNGIQREVLISKDLFIQLALEEPQVVVWENLNGSLNITDNLEFMNAYKNKNVLSIIALIDEKAKTEDLYETLMSSKEYSDIVDGLIKTLSPKERRLSNR